MSDKKINFIYANNILNFFKRNKKKRYLVIAGGRGKGATHSFMTLGVQESFIISRGKFLFTREIKESVDESTKAKIESIIHNYGLTKYFHIGTKEIVNKQTKTKFIFTGLSTVTEDQFKGMEEIDICHIGEGHAIDKTPLQKMLPTIRKKGSRIWVDYNPEDAGDAVHDYFTQNPSKFPYGPNEDLGDDLAYLLTDYRGNNFLTEELASQAEKDKKIYSLKDFEWIWLGKLKESFERYLVIRSDVEAAFARKTINTSSAPVVGADIAHLGGDYVVFYYRTGNQIRKKYKRKYTKDDITATGKIKNELQAFVNYDKSVLNVIDNGHIGAAVADLMIDDGYNVQRVDFGSTKKENMQYDPAHSADVTTDMSRKVAEMIHQLCFDTDESDDELINQMTQRQWDFAKGETNVIKLEPKPEFKKHYTGKQGSPDDDDALKLCCYYENYRGSFKSLGNGLGGR